MTKMGDDIAYMLAAHFTYSKEEVPVTLIMGTLSIAMFMEIGDSTVVCLQLYLV